MQFPRTSLSAMLMLGLAACGGGGSDGGAADSGTPAAAAIVSQAEASAVVTQANSASVLVRDIYGISAVSASILANLDSGSGTTAVQVSCAGGGSYQLTYSKSSQIRFVQVGDTATIDYAQCNYSSGKTTYSGNVVIKVSALSGSVVGGQQSYDLRLANFKLAFAGTNGALLDTMDGWFTTQVSSDKIAVTASGTLSGTLMGYSASAGVLDGSYAPFNIVSSMTFGTAPASLTESLGFSTPYAGSDGQSWPLAVSTISPVTVTSSPTNVPSISTPGKFSITGYRGATVQVVNDTLNTSTISVDNGSDSTIDLTFSLDGQYLM